MKKISGSDRQLNILQYLRDGGSAGAEALAGQFGVSERTIRNDIRAVNERLGDSGIIESRKGEFFLHVIDRDAFRLIYSSFLEEDDRFNSSENRRNYCFGRLMRQTEPVLTDELAYEMNIGRTTMISDLKRLREALAAYNIRIEGKTSKGLVLEGGELDIRRYLLENCYEEVYSNYPIDDEIIDMLEVHLKKQGYEKHVRNMCRRYMIVSLDRFLTGHFIGRLPERYYNLTARREFERVDFVVNRIADYLHTGIPIEEKIFVMLPAVGMRTPTDFSDAYMLQLDEQMSSLMDRIISEVSERLDMKLSKDKFAEEFVYHLMFMVNRIKFAIPLTNPLLDDIKRKYPLAYRMAEIAGVVIENEIGMPVSEDEMGHMASYFGIYLEQSKQNFGRQFSVAVVCGTGRVTAKLILVQLKKILDESVRIDLYSDEKANIKVLNDYDVVLSTMDLSYEPKVPVIRIREIFDEKKLARQIENVRLYGSTQSGLADESGFILEEMLVPTDFFRFVDETYEGALAKMAQQLVADGNADAGLYGRLQLREKRGTMVFENGVALPHTTHYASDRVGLCIGVFDKPYIYNGKNVKMIFLLAIPNKVRDDDLLVRLYEEIIDIAHDAEHVKGLIKAKDYKEFIKALHA